MRELFNLQIHNHKAFEDIIVKYKIAIKIRCFSSNMHLPGNETRLLMSYEYRYAVGQFLLSPVGGFWTPKTKKAPTRW